MPTDLTVSDDDAVFTDTAGDDTAALSTPVSGTLSGAGDSDTLALDGAVADSSHAGFDVAASDAYGTMYFNTTTGAYTFLADDDAIEGLGDGATDTPSFTFSATDSLGMTRNAAFSFTVSGAEDTPILAPISTIVFQDTPADDHFAPVLGQLLTRDPDSGETLTYGLSGGTAEAFSDTSGDYDLVGHSYIGVLHLSSATGAYEFVPDSTVIQGFSGRVYDGEGDVDNGGDRFHISVSDGTSSVQQDLVIEAFGVEEPDLDFSPHADLVEANGVASGVSNSSVTLLLTSRDSAITAAHYSHAGLLADGWTYGGDGAWFQSDAYGTAFIDQDSDSLRYQLGNSLAATQALRSGDTVTISFVLTVASNERGSVNGHFTILDGATHDSTVSFTIHGSDELSLGTSTRDVLTGTDYADDMYGFAGNDSLLGGAGDDVLDGGDGNDALNGGSGNDTMTGGAGNDTYYVSDPADVVREDAGGGSDTVRAKITYTLAANVENLTLIGSSNVAGTGNELDNVLTGNGGNNVLSGLDGNDSLHGGAGMDTLDGGAGNDLLDGGDGSDTASYASATAGVCVSLAITGAQDTGGAGIDSLGAIENLTGSAFADRLTGGAGNNVLNGGDGDDVIYAGAGNDTVNGGVGSDTLSFADASQSITCSLADSAVQSTGGGTITAIHIENLEGSAFADILIGRSSANVLTGGGGADTLTGGTGADIFVYRSASDSTGTAYDSLTDVRFAHTDRIDTLVQVTGVDGSLTVGTLDAGVNFDSELASALGSHLNADHALAFRASAGSLIGETFLVIDQNGIAGYQSGQDIVIHLQAGVNIATLDVTDFI